MAKIGDVFEVRESQRTVGVLHYVARDSTQLQSHVVRAYQRTNIPADRAKLEQVLAERPSFFTHVAIPVGVKHGVFVPATRVPPPKLLNMWFRQANDYGSQSPTSNNWSVWQVGMPMKRVTRLSQEQAEFEIGLVVNPYDVLHRLRTGTYEFFYPAAS